MEYIAQAWKLKTMSTWVLFSTHSYDLTFYDLKHGTIKTGNEQNQFVM